MKRLAALLFVISGLPCLSFAQSEDIKPALSKTPLTAEQIAVYQAFLRLYAGKNKKVLHVADTTEWMDVSNLKEDEDCLQSFGQLEFPHLKQNNPTVHVLDPSLAVAGRIALVNSERQSEIVKENDPSKTMREGKSVDKAVNDASDTGLLTLSEIVFDKDHHIAVISFGFYCGRLCGNGATIVLKRVGNKWKITKQICAMWIS